MEIIQTISCGQRYLSFRSMQVYLYTHVDFYSVLSNKLINKCNMHVCTHVVGHLDLCKLGLNRPAG